MSLFRGVSALIKRPSAAAGGAPASPAPNRPSGDERTGARPGGFAAHPDAGQRGRFAAFIKGIIHSRSSTSTCPAGAGRGCGAVRGPGDAAVPGNGGAALCSPRNFHPNGLIHRLFHAKRTNLRSCRHLVGLNTVPPRPGPQPAAFTQPGPWSPAGAGALRHPHGPERLTSALQRCLPPASPGASSRSSGPLPRGATRRSRAPPHRPRPRPHTLSAATCGRGPARRGVTPRGRGGLGGCPEGQVWGSAPPAPYRSEHGACPGLGSGAGRARGRRGRVGVTAGRRGQRAFSAGAKEGAGCPSALFQVCSPADGLRRCKRKSCTLEKGRGRQFRCSWSVPGTVFGTSGGASAPCGSLQRVWLSWLKAETKLEVGARSVCGNVKERQVP